MNEGLAHDSGSARCYGSIYSLGRRLPSHLRTELGGLSAIHEASHVRRAFLQQELAYKLFPKCIEADRM